MKKTGILLPVSSLPSDTGCGGFGKYAYEFVDILAEAGVGIWQILPLNPLGYGNSPYQPYSSYAGDEIYIDLEELAKEGLIQSWKPFRAKEGRVNYEEVRKFRESYLREAFDYFEETDDFRDFLRQDWVYPYGVFRSFKKANGERCWNEWPRWQRDWPLKREGDLDAFEEEIRFHIFLQYCFYYQWNKLRAYTRSREILIMGDMPFYVGLDSQDVWAGRENFLLDEEGKPTFIAGVPPDYFSATGQRWGNPIYNWDYIKERQYRFWIDRVGHSGKLFDIVRIDHFRAFDTFWKIPASCPTAVEGCWIEAPGYEVLDALLAACPNIHLVAEDLGDLRPEVLVLKNHYGLKGMKVIQFSIQTAGKYAKDAFPEQENLVVYTGTHDNDTLRSWYEEQSTASKRKIRKFLKRNGFKQGQPAQRLIRYALSSAAEYSILPMTDVLGLRREGRLNTPGTVGSPNWEWKLINFESVHKNLPRLKNGFARQSIKD